jgi:pyruvate dehydrogenase E1 component alpha subunit
MKLDPEKLLEIYQTMLRIRRFEERVGELFLQGRIWGAVHLYSGEEAMAVGACSALRADDYITSTHRGHGHCIAKGADTRNMMAEIFGRRDGYCKGKGGSMHIADVQSGNLGANAIVGDGIAIACGAALASRIKHSDQISLAFFGDGAVGTGIFHESMNLAAVLQLPVVFACENNQYAVSTAMKDSSPVPRVADRAAAYNIPAATVDGNDVLAVYSAVQEAADRARSGGGPTLVEGLTYRWEGHYKGDPESYRSAEEVASWRQNDPIVRFRSWLLANEECGEEQLVQIEELVEQELQEAVAFAEASPQPALDELHTDIYIA